MNYFEDHIGDYAAATAHLSWDEDMAYTRLIRAYYHAEKPIPAAQAYRLARAATPAQRRAVDSVLGEFFRLEDGAYRQKRCDEEIARFQDKQAKAKRSAEARWSGHKPQSERNANASDKDMRTHSEGNALQSPDTRPNSVPDGTDGAAVIDVAALTKAELWAAGKSLLSEQGMPAAQCGSFVGKLVKDYGEAIVVEAVRATVVKGPPDAKEFLKGCCLHAAGQRKQAEPEWRAEQRERTQLAAPGVAAGQSAAEFFIDVEAKNVTPHALA